ncbi:amphi-Trp domain-containing protein [Natronolimnobius baerhuensis]|uniref:Amphi-Trp domain-containing protein n=1 Tax=Natronolimnobius baerhuensis TaxID=253108 RepID=A0A202EBL2_9EURY|nr:amphi-Trp domain-containing protein [Natronolimnobius baerhuensis]OVE85615.1 amphi-Trp domain-containing protein [Natronolimnobius baerhuensis]
MAETTANTEDLSRDEAADFLQGLAQELRGTGDANIRIGNKTLTLRPSSTVEYEIEAQERSPMLGGQREEVTVTVGWELEDDGTE